MVRGGQTPLKRVFFEFVRKGNVVKVSAIDPDTGFEGAIVGDPRAGEETLKRMAMRKLEYVLAREAKRGS